MRACDARNSASEQVCNEMIVYNSKDAKNTDNAVDEENGLRMAAGFPAIDED